jgi:hypothetical protein
MPGPEAAVRRTGWSRAMHAMPSPVFRRLSILVGGYLVVAAFGVATLVVGLWRKDLSTTELLVTSAVFAAPVALMFLWDRLTGAKVGPVEVSFVEVRAKLDLNVADQFQTFGPIAISDSRALLEKTIAGMRDSESSRLLVINLRDGDYWWSTRLFLLIALTDDYTRVETAIFVEGGPDMHFVGTANVSRTRQALIRHFPGYEMAYQYCLEGVRGLHNSQTANPPLSGEEEVTRVVLSWGNVVGSVLSKGSAPGRRRAPPPRLEGDLADRVGRPSLVSWLPTELDTDSVEWDGLPFTDKLRYRVLGQSGHYAALTQDGRLKAAVDRVALATLVSQKALRHVLVSESR